MHLSKQPAPIDDQTPGSVYVRQRSNSVHHVQFKLFQRKPPQHEIEQSQNKKAVSDPQAEVKAFQDSNVIQSNSQMSLPKIDLGGGPKEESKT